MQGGLAEFSRGMVDVSPGLEESRNGFCVAILGGQVQGGLVVVRIRRGVDIGSGLQE